MPISAGEKLDSYETLSVIGAGGAGEVYKARDTCLDRTVAVKMLPEGDPPFGVIGISRLATSSRPGIGTITSLLPLVQAAVVCCSSEVEVTACSDLADLFIIGSDFYSGSVGKSLKNGWCDFEELGLKQAPERFGSNWKLGKVWYIAERVPEDALKGFAEPDRQNIWFDAQGANVIRVVIDSKQQKKETSPFVAGRGCSFRTEADAIDAIRGIVLAPAAMVISAGNEQTPLLTLLDEKCRHKKILLPPESAVEHIAGKHRLEHSDLEAAQLSGSKNDALWKSYERSRNDRKVVEEWLDDLSDSEEREWLTQFLHGKLPRSPKNFLTNARTDQAIIDRVIKRVKPYLKAHGSVNNHLARDEHRCIPFIARSLIKVVADDVCKERLGPDSEQRSSIRSGRDLIAQAARVYPKIEICKEAEKQIRDMTGHERFFGWVLDAFHVANREMLAWNGGPFPHHLLPGPATPESESVMTSSRLKKMRYFRTRNGEELLFEHHMKNRAENQRIHYLVDPKRSRLLMIGYVGPKLST